MKNKYIATIVLHALGDTIGFKNGEWEFYGPDIINDNLLPVLELVYQFIGLGGVNGINLQGWQVSDDTLLHIDITKSLLNTTNNIDDIIKLIINRFIKTKKKYFISNIDKNLKTLLTHERAPGFTTMRSITALENNEKIKYDETSGGNGAAMRTLAVGLAYYNNLDKLIEISIKTSKITHTSAIGYLAGLTSAYMVSLAIQNINIEKWPFMLIDLLESNKVIKYINMNNKSEVKDYQIYLDKWKKYIELRFDNYKPNRDIMYNNFLYRTKFYLNNFVDPVYSRVPGESGYGVTIMAYDSLLDSGPYWEKLIFYSMLHIGDTDTVGCIAAGLYGALYGFGDVPESNLKYLEFKDKLYNLGEKLYNKFYTI